MITVNRTLTTSRPRREVFDYLADFTTVAEWDPGIVSSQRTSGDGGVGTEYAVTATFSGREIPMTYEVLEHAAPERIVLRGVGKAVDAVDTITFAESDAGTEVTYRAEFRLKGVMRFASPFLGGVFRRLGDAAIAGMDEAVNG